jgi:hypothetical protein
LASISFDTYPVSASAPEESIWRAHAGIPRGWLPVDISRGIAIVRWIEIGSRLLSEPFFGETVRHLRMGSPRARECETDLSILEGIETPVSLEPSCLIVHMTRCGSTLLANSFRAAADCTVVSEAASIGRVLGWIGSPSRHWASVGARFITPVLGAFAAYHGFCRRHIVIKCGNEGLHAVSALRSRWPRVPCIILVRNPVEVLISNVQTPSRMFLDWKESPRRTLFGVPPHEAAAEGAIGFYSWALGRFCIQAADVLDEYCRVVDYTELNAERILDLMRFCKLSLDPERENAFWQGFRADAKRSTVDFQDDSLLKRQSAPEAAHRNARTWIERPYNELRRRAALWNHA